MFTGIIETVGTVNKIEKEKDNLHITLESKITSDLKIDQSVSHNGVCLTVIDINNNYYTVTAIKETLNKTNLKYLQVGDKVNLERAMLLSQRLDGHLVQGHIDEIGTCIEISENNGSWIFTFKYDKNSNNIIIEKGSITVNGVSLTAFQIEENTFSVAIIPYTYQHTNFNQLKLNQIVNLEFDVIGKYIQRLQKLE